MDDQTTVILYGRPEHGVDMATRILADAAFHAKHITQDFVVRSLETTGSVIGTVKITKQPIVSRQFEQGDIVLLFDARMKEVTKRCNNGTLIYNSTEKEKFKSDKIKVFHVPATQIILDIGRSATLVPVMLGAFSKLFGKIPMKYFKIALEAYGGNYTAFEEGARQVKRG